MKLRHNFLVPFEIKHIIDKMRSNKNSSETVFFVYLTTLFSCIAVSRTIVSREFQPMRSEVTMANFKEASQN